MAHVRGSVADRMAFFRKAAEDEKKMNSRVPRKPKLTGDSNNNVPANKPTFQTPTQPKTVKENEKLEQQEDEASETPMEEKKRIEKKASQRKE